MLNKDWALNAYIDREEQHKDKIMDYAESICSEAYTGDTYASNSSIHAYNDLCDLLEVAYKAAFKAGYKTFQELN